VKSLGIYGSLAVLIALAPAPPAGAQVPPKLQRQQPRTLERTDQSQRPSGPATPANKPGEDLPGDTRAPGGPSGKVTDKAKTQVPGTGGSTAAQTQPSSGPANPTPTSLFDPTKAKPHDRSLVGPDGKVVGPDYFKSREERVGDLANPGMPAPASSPPGGDATKKKLDPSGSDVLGGVSTTITPGQGKNRSTEREQQSELTATGKTEGSEAVITVAGNKGEVSWNISQDAKLTKETIRVKGDGYEVVLTKDYGKTGTVETTKITLASGETWTKVNNGAWVQGANAGGTKKTPNPETDTGDHVPKGVLTGQQPTPKSPSELEAERRRQTTLPSDDQTRTLERVRMEAKTALQSAASKRTDGRIDPNDRGDGGTIAGTNRNAPRPGTGCVQVDCVPPKGTRPGGTGQGPSGSDPPNR
jgi:hypothetical protein